MLFLRFEGRQLAVGGIALHSIEYSQIENLNH